MKTEVLKVKATQINKIYIYIGSNLNSIDVDSKCFFADLVH